MSLFLKTTTMNAEESCCGWVSQSVKSECFYDKGTFNIFIPNKRHYDSIFFLIFEGEKICFSSCYIFYCLIHFSLVLTYQPLLPGSPNLPTQLPSRLYIIPPSAHLQVTLIVLPLSSLLIHLPFQPSLTVFLSASLLPSF